MSKVKEQLDKYSRDLMTIIKGSLEGAYIIGAVTRRDSDLVLTVCEDSMLGTMHYEIIVRPQPYLSGVSEKKNPKT